MVWQALANPATLGAIASIGSSVLGGMAGGDAAKTQERLAKDAVRIAGTAYSPINVADPFGMGVSFGAGGSGGGGFAGGNIVFPGAGSIKQIAPGYRQVGKYGIQSDIGSVNLNYGDLTNPRAALGALAGQQAQGAGLQGLSPLQLLGLGLAGQGAQSGQQEMQNLSSILGLSGGALGMGFNELSGAYANPFQAALQQQLFGGAAGQFADAATGFGDYRNQTLDLLRQQAEPFESRALSSLQDQLFAQGRMGSTGGGLQMEAFARGLGQADLQRQLQAGEEARAAQSQAMNMGQGLAGRGLDLQTMQNNILSSAMDRFGGMAELSSRLGSQRTAAGLGVGGSLFQLGEQALTSPYNVQAQALNNLSAILGGVGDINQQGLNLAELANTFMSNQANTRTGQANAISRGAESMTASDRYKADLFGSLAGALGGGGGALDTLMNAWKTNRAIQPIDLSTLPKRI